MWRKKIERDVSQGVPLDMFSVKSEKKKQRERMVRYDSLRLFSEIYLWKSFFFLSLKLLIILTKAVK